MVNAPTLRAVVTKDNDVETDYGKAVRKDHISLGRPQGVHRWLETEVYDHDSGSVIVNRDMFTIEEADEMLKQEYPEDEEIIEKIKQIALEEGMLKIEVLR